jgi:hypothetical protein
MLGSNQRPLPCEGSYDRKWGGLLDRLEDVCETGSGRWLARCPAHDDKSPSLSIRDASDRLLIHCFAGCEPLDVVHAAGMELSDLFADNTPTDHRQRAARSRPLASDALAAVSHEVQVATLICADVLACKAIDEATWNRLARAAGIISNARAQACPARVQK